MTTPLSHSSSPTVPKKLPNQFILSLYSIIASQQYADMVNWGPEADRSFTIYKPHIFSQVVLPQLCKHANLSSFIRQLNMYCFKKFKTKHEPQAISYFHPYFIQGKPDLLKLIVRKNPRQTQKKAGAQGDSGVSPTSDSSPLDDYFSMTSGFSENNSKNDSIQDNQIPPAANSITGSLDDILNHVCSKYQNEALEMIRAYLNDEGDGSEETFEHTISKKVKISTEYDLPQEEIKNYVTFDLETLEPLPLRSSQNKDSLKATLPQSLLLFNQNDYVKCQSLVSNLFEVTDRARREDNVQMPFQNFVSYINEDFLDEFNSFRNDFF